MKKLNLPDKPSAAVELLREHLRWIYRPIVRETESPDLTDKSIDMSQPLHSARDAARVLGVPLSQILKAIHGKVISPQATTSGQVIITSSDLETLRLHLTK